MLSFIYSCILMTKKGRISPLRSTRRGLVGRSGEPQGYFRQDAPLNLGKKGWERVPQAKKPSRVRAMSSKAEGFRTVPREFVAAKAENGAVKAVFDLVYVKSAGNGVVSALVYGK
jgi:hypothetical protein